MNNRFFSVIFVGLLVVIAVTFSFLQSENNKSQLIQAIEKNDLQGVLSSLEKGRLSEVSEDYIPLHVAIWEGELAIAVALLEYGADPNQLNKQGLAPVHVAVGNERIIKFLLKHGADLKVRDPAGRTALHHAVRKGEPEVVQFLMKNGLNVDYRDRRERTALHYAARQGNVLAVKMLLEGGADSSIKDSEGKTALELAAESGQDEVVKYMAGFRD